MSESKQKGAATRLLHPDYEPKGIFNATPVAMHRASTVLFDSVADMRTRRWQEREAYTYGLHGTPTTHTLEGRLAEIEGGKHCITAPSGLAAIVMASFALLKTGDEVLMPDNIYGNTRELGDWMAQDFGVKVHYYDPLDLEAFAALFKPRTALVWTEAPGSVSMEVPDLPALCRIAKEKGVTVALDNTWSAGLANRAFELGVDISMQALTKYQSGGSDVLMGALITNDEALYKKLLRAHARLGFNIGIDDAYLVLRGLETMRVRFAAHDAGARAVAAWLDQREEISVMLHPAYPSCPGHAHWQRDFNGAGGLFSVIFDEKFTEAQTDKFVDSLQLFGIGYSWGGTHSLCLPYRMQHMRSRWSQKGILVRLYIGLEDPADLIADIEQALAKM